MCCDGGADACRSCSRLGGEDRSAIQVAADAGDWARVAKLARPYRSAVVVEEGDRAALDAALFTRGLITYQEPGSAGLMVVPLTDVLENGDDLGGFSW